MAEAQQSERSSRICIVCAEPINARAIRCKHCGSFQNWRRYLVLSTTALSLLVALVSVLAVSTPVIRDAFRADNSEIFVSLHRISGQHVVLYVSNTGTRPGTLSTAELKIGDLLTLDLRIGVLDGGPAAGYVDAGRNGPIMLWHPGPVLSRPPRDYPDRWCRLLLSVNNFDGSRMMIEIKRKCREFESFVQYYFGRD